MLARTILLLTIAVTAAVARPIVGIDALSHNGFTSGSSPVKNAHTTDSGRVVGLHFASDNTAPFTYVVLPPTYDPILI